MGSQVPGKINYGRILYLICARCGENLTQDQLGGMLMPYEDLRAARSSMFKQAREEGWKLYKKLWVCEVCATPAVEGVTKGKEPKND